MLPELKLVSSNKLKSPQRQPSKRGNRRLKISILLSPKLMEWIREESFVQDVSLSFTIANLIKYVSGIEDK